MKENFARMTGDGDGYGPGDEPALDTQSSGPKDAVAAKNRLLSAMTGDDYALLEPHLEQLYLDTGDVIVQPGVSFTHVYFPEAAILSVVNYMEDGSGVEVGTVGNEGMAGLAAYLEADASKGKPLPAPGGRASAYPVQEVITASANSPGIRRLLNRYTQAYMTQVAQSAACNRPAQHRAAVRTLAADDARSHGRPHRHHLPQARVPGVDARGTPRG